MNLNSYREDVPNWWRGGQADEHARNAKMRHRNRKKGKTEIGMKSNLIEVQAQAGVSASSHCLASTSPKEFHVNSPLYREILEQYFEANNWCHGWNLLKLSDIEMFTQSQYYHDPDAYG